LLKKVLSWEPELSLEDGLKRTYAWIEKQVMSSDYVKKEFAGNPA
jgi:dTDP-D-glucose 4,6-dehydratase